MDSWTHEQHILKTLWLHTKHQKIYMSQLYIFEHNKMENIEIMQFIVQK